MPTGGTTVRSLLLLLAACAEGGTVDVLDPTDTDVDLTPVDTEVVDTEVVDTDVLDPACTPRALQIRRSGGPLLGGHPSNGLAWHPDVGGLSWGHVDCSGDAGWCGPLDDFPFPDGPMWSLWPRSFGSCVVAAGGDLTCRPSATGSGASLLPRTGLVEVLAMYAGIRCHLTTADELACTSNADADAAVPTPRLSVPVVTATAGLWFRSSGARPRGCGLTTGGQAHCFGDARLDVFADADGCWRELALAEWGTIACGIDGDGEATCVDLPRDGVPQPPAGTPPPPGPLHALAVEAGHACALDADDHVVCWGAWGEGEPTGDRDDAPADEAFVELALSGGGACGMRADGSLRCWGHPTPFVTDAP